MSSKERVLIVDDMPINLDILEELLFGEYEIFRAESGEEALAKIEDIQPGLVLLDVMMPGIDGFETCRRIVSKPELKRTSVVMVSAKCLPEDRQAGLDAGAVDYVTKPYDIFELKSLVDRLMRQLERLSA